MVNAYIKNIFRTIRGSLGRYIAIMAIIALGVGFFAGLKSTKPAFAEKADTFFSNNNMYDIRVVSTLGFTEDEVEKIQALLGDDGVCEADFYEDVYCRSKDTVYVCRFFELNNKVNLVRLSDGRMPEKYGECAISYSPSKDVTIGDKLYIDNANEYSVLNRFDCLEYTVTGIVESPLYIGTDRDNTSLGGGKITSNVYVNDDCLDILFYKSLSISFDTDKKAYTKEYDKYVSETIEKYKEGIKEILTKRYESYKENMPDFQDITLDVYYFSRSENQGYLSFKSDMDIVENVSKVFPVFFFLIAALVCSTTMARMIDEEREQIGILRALGYKDFTVLMKYVLYSGSSALIGCIVGFFAGTRIFPFVIDNAYSIMYCFGGRIEYYFSWKLFVACLIVSLLCSVGTTIGACYRELHDMPAVLIRDKMPRAGKRILLERMGFIWKRLKFLHKVTLRNVFRFKKRLFMMIIGIAGCQALVLVSFGIKDSISGVSKKQFEEVSVYDFDVTFKNRITLENIEEKLGNLEGVERYSFIERYYCELIHKDARKVFLCICDEEELDGFINRKVIKGSNAYPKKGEILLSNHVCDILDLKVGDYVSFNIENNRSESFKIIGIYDNYVYHYGFISRDNFETEKNNTIMLKLKGEEYFDDVKNKLASDSDVVNVLLNREVEYKIDDMMQVLNLIVLLIIGCAAMLAFVVLFNLSNINIIERKREIATVKVLGFYENETRNYVFRENAVFTFQGIMIGIPLGILLLRFVMDQIRVDLVAFGFCIKPFSYVISIILTILFTVTVNFVMRKKVEVIDMTTSLKSAE